MVTSVDLTKLDLWFKVENANFAEDMAYRAIAYLDYGESADGQLLFVTDEGAVYALPVRYTRCVSGHERHSRELKQGENVDMFAPGEVKGWR